MSLRKKNPLTYRRLNRDGSYCNNRTAKIVYPHSSKDLEDNFLRYILVLGQTAIARWFQDGGLDHIFTGDLSYADKPWESLGISKREFMARKAEAFNIMAWMFEQVLINEFDDEVSRGKPNPFTISPNLQSLGTLRGRSNE